MADSVAEHIAALHDQDWGVREDAATALGAFADPRSVLPLISALKDSDRAVRTAAIASLTAIGEPAVVPLGHCLQDPDLNVQESAAYILATIGDHQVLEPLIAALLNANWIVRSQAARALGRIGDPRAIDTLILLLQDKVPAVREEAVAALTALGELSIPPLLEALNHKEWRVRLRAIEALALLKPQAATEPLLGLVDHDPDTAVRQDAIRALGEIGDPRSVEPLMNAMNQTSLKTHAITALGRIGNPQAVPRLMAIVNGLVTEQYEGRMAACEDDRYQEELPPVEAAVKALAQIGDTRAIPTLLEALKSTLIRVEAAEALTRFGKDAKSPLIERYKQETDDNIRFHVKETLARLGWRPNQYRL
jgi:HEAT repeat protein